MKDYVAFQDPGYERFRFQLRFLAVILMVLCAFCLLFGRFFWLQLLQHEKFSTLAENNRISLVPIPPARGIVKDRNGLLLANNYSAYTLEITPSKVKDIDAMINALSELLSIEAKDRRRFKKIQEDSKNHESIPIRTRLNDTEIALFAANSYRFPGVEIKARLFREYPLEMIGSHIIGHIGRINAQDMERLTENDELANYRGSAYIGKMGLELSYESILHGKTGYEELEVEASGRAVRSLNRSAPQPGKNLILSIDLKLQQMAEKLFDDHNGALVAIEPKTGGILAFVSQPGFNPNLFVDGIDTQSWNELNNSPHKPLLNRALRGEYPPGSTFKPFVALGALEMGIRTPSQTIYDPGHFMFGGHKFRDSNPRGRGAVNMPLAITVSSDTYFYMLANDMGIDRLSRFIGNFGLGSLTGIDLPGEKAGVLPSPEWKRKRFKKPEQQIWYAGETISIGIGQGYNAYTPLQMAQATAIVANDGIMFKPHIVQFIEDPKTGVKMPISTQPVKKLPFKRENLAVVKQSMVNVVRSGTGARLFAGAPYQAAGKTGTAQVVGIKQNEKYVASRLAKKHRDHSWFIAYAPADSPTIALAIIVENGGWGASAAGPIARKVLDYYLLGKAPQTTAADETADEDSGEEEEFIGD
jgi:penicillin-binding protein 2